MTRRLLCGLRDPWRTFLPQPTNKIRIISQLKVIVEVIFDEFIDTDIVGLEAQMEHLDVEMLHQLIDHLGSGAIQN